MKYRINSNKIKDFLRKKVVPGVAENIKIISEKACSNIAHFAFNYAIQNNRKKVTACHKAGIM